MTYVYNSMASGIKREPTEAEVKLVEDQDALQRDLYKTYNSLLDSKLDKSLMVKLWIRYLKEYTEYNRLFDLYMGYCY